MISQRGDLFIQNPSLVLIHNIIHIHYSVIWDCQCYVEYSPHSNSCNNLKLDIKRFTCLGTQYNLRFLIQ
jgi:hypothetical protein